jgi:hypothetical protein
MPLPYRIELAEQRSEVTRDRPPPDWPKGVPWKRPVEREYVVNKVAVKVYPDGRRAEATAEELVVWEHIQGLEAYKADAGDRFVAVVRQRDAAEAKVAELAAQLETAKAKKGGR